MLYSININNDNRIQQFKLITFILNRRHNTRINVFKMLYIFRI